MLKPERFALAALSAALLGGCANECGNSVVTKLDAPSGNRTAVMFQRDCGATTSFTTQISIIEPAGDLTGGGNVFVADTDHGAARPGTWGGPWAEMRWIGPNHLLIRHSSKARTFQKQAEVAGVRINYEPVTP